MKLNKLYTNNKNFKNIKFNSGLNVIYAEVKSDISEKKNSHNLGKTLFSEIIDFMLLKKVNKNHFLVKAKDINENQIFKDYIFYLEVLLDSGKYLTIKRGIDNHSKVSFKLNEQETDGFTPPQKWDDEDFSFESAKSALAEYLNFDFFRDKKDYDFRKSINYSIRQQRDYDDIYRLTKFKGRDLYWKPFMFDLLGFNGNLLKRKYEIDEQVEKVVTNINSLKKDFSVKVEERDELVAQSQLIEDKYQEVEHKIDKFNFYEQDKELIKEGADQIEIEISDLNTLSYNLEYDINRLKKSIKNEFSFDLKKVEQLFEETNLYLPEQLKKEYQELIDFNKAMTVERNKLLKQTLNKKSTELKSIQEQLENLNKRKEELLSLLQESDSFKKFKQYQKQLVKLEGQLIQLKEKINIIDNILGKEKEINVLKKKLEEIIEGINKEFKATESNETYKDIRKKFANYYKEILNEDAFISWEINTSNNVDFKTPIVVSGDGTKKSETSQGDGYTYGKLFCVVFDLALLTTYNSQSYYKFVYHDDVFANEDNGVKIRFLELIRKLIKSYDLQYIFSIIKADLPVDETNKPIKFDKSEIILELNDKNADGSLFGFNF